MKQAALVKCKDLVGRLNKIDASNRRGQIVESSAWKQKKDERNSGVRSDCHIFDHSRTSGFQCTVSNSN